MKLTTLLMILLSNQGHWAAGTDGVVQFQWTADAVAAHAAGAELAWELRLASVPVASGRVPVKDGRIADVTIEAPTVRARSEFTFHYTLRARDGAKPLESGQRTIVVYPADLTAGMAGAVEGKKLAVVGGAGSLGDVLRAAGVPHELLHAPGKLATRRPDVVLVAEDVLGKTEIDQSAPLALAESGATVVILRQTRPRQVAGYPLTPRRAVGELAWRTGHALLAGIDESILRSWEEHLDAEVLAVALPAGEAALELAYWPAEARAVRGGPAAPVDALLVTKSVGAGRVVLCQLPLGDWQRDPRSQLFLVNLLNYAATRPEPTPPPSRRAERRPQPPAPPSVPTITIPPGDRP